VGTLVERTTRYVVLLHLPDGRAAHLVEQAMRQAISALPADLARTITWDQGKEMANHAEFTLATRVVASSTAAMTEGDRRIPAAISSASVGTGGRGTPAPF
jgi:IS30 family transposase